MADCSVIVRIEDRYNKEAGLKVLETLNLGSLHGQLEMFNLGQLSPEQIANSIINNLFDRDKKWDVDYPNCCLKESPVAAGQEFPVSYSCSQSATWDHKDIYAVANSSTTVVIKSRSEIDINSWTK